MVNVGNERVVNNDQERVEALAEANSFVAEFSRETALPYGTDLVLKKQFGELESVESVREAGKLLKTFVEDRDYELSTSLVAAVSKSLVYFPDAENTGIIGLNELISSGDLGVDEAPSEEDISVIGHYLSEGAKHGLEEVDIRILAETFEIPDTVRGLELIQLLANKFENNETIQPKMLLELGVISEEEYQDFLNYMEAQEVDELEQEAEGDDLGEEEDEKVENSTLARLFDGDKIKPQHLPESDLKDLVDDEELDIDDVDVV